MAKQTLAVFTENELDRNYMCKILSQVFSNCPKVRQCWLQTSPDGLRRIW